MMKQDQDKRHFCKLCNKSFTSGKVLGGHMRSHITKKNSTRTEKKLNKMMMMDCEGGGGAVGYGLRENPKKSWKFSVSEEEEVVVSGQENLCKICGKVFDSMRALFGHMRHHSRKRRRGVGVRCKECDQEFESLRALTGHMKSSHHPERIRVSKESTSISTTQKLFVDSQYSSENSGLIRRKKRSRRLRYKISPNYSFANLSENSSYVTESEQEVVEVAVTLLMLSRGVWNRDGFSSATESSDNNSANFEVKSLNQTQTVVANGGGNYVCDDDEAFKMKKPRLEKLKCCLSNPKIAFGEKKVCAFSENDSGFVSDEGKIVKLEVSIDRLYKGVAYQMPNLYDDSQNKNGSHEEVRMSIINPLEVELHENFTEEIRLDPAGLGSMKSSLSKKARIDACFDQLRGSPCAPSASEIFDDYRRKNEYKCRICNKIFHSHQALGGHQTIHRTSKNSHGLQIDDPESFSNTKTFSEIEADSKVDKSEFNEDSMVKEMDRVTVVTSCESKVHKCPVCFKVFASGQALGGHKRAHFSKDSETGEEQISLLNQELSDICDKVIGIDVRIEEDEAKADVELKSWWVKNDQKHELLVGLIPN